MRRSATLWLLFVFGVAGFGGWLSTLGASSQESPKFNTADETVWTTDNYPQISRLKIVIEKSGNVRMSMFDQDGKPLPWGEDPPYFTLMLGGPDILTDSFGVTVIDQRRR